MKKFILTVALLNLAIQLYSQSSEKIVRQFLSDVRSGNHPEKASFYMADTVLAHQLTSENPTTVKRTPENYAAHIQEFLRLFGKYEFEITELIAWRDKVYVRWKQTGKHLAEIDGVAPTNLPLVEFSSAVYRVKNKKIVEYWIQTDRLGFDIQLKRSQVP